MAEETGKEVLTLAEAARFVRVSEKTLREMARSRRLPCQKVGRAWRFLRSALESWLAHQEFLPAVGEPQTQYLLPPITRAAQAGRQPSVAGFGDTAFTRNRSEPLHRWVPWIAGFSSAFVGGVLEAARGRDPADVAVLDPFAGVGTTLVEAMARGYDSLGFEINPYAALACRTKLACLGYDPRALRRVAAAFSGFMAARSNAPPRSRPPLGFKSRVPFFSPKVEPQVLRALDFIAEQREEWVRDLLRVALGAVMVGFSNYSYEPSLGRRSVAGKHDILDAEVASVVGAKLDEMIGDIAEARLLAEALGRVPKAQVYCESFLTGHARLPARSVDFLITSPPYLNNYHYIRNTRPQVYWLGLIESPAQLRAMEEQSFGKFWQTVRGGPRVELAADCPGLAEVIEEVRRQKPERGIYGGSGWANYAAAYFNDCLAFCRAAARLMKPGGAAVIVIGNNILQGIEIKTDVWLARIAETCGFETVALHPVRRKRTGSSIIASSVRVAKAAARVELYETAVELRLKHTQRRGSRSDRGSQLAEWTWHVRPDGGTVVLPGRSSAREALCVLQPEWLCRHRLGGCNRGAPAPDRLGKPPCSRARIPPAHRKAHRAEGELELLPSGQ